MFEGMLRRIGTGTVVLTADDRRTISAVLAGSTKYTKATDDQPSAPAKPADFQPGDHVSVDATQDDKGDFHVVEMRRLKAGSEDEKTAALGPVDISPLGPGLGAGDDDPDRPRLKRAAPAADIQEAEADAPVRRATALAPKPAAPDADDPGPPRLARNRNAGAAPAAVPFPEPEPEPALRPQQPARPNEGNLMIAKAREAAEIFSETLPNYEVKRVTTRYQTEAARGRQTSWRAVDTITADVSSKAGKDTYSNLTVNGKRSAEAPEKTGAWSSGEFSSTLLDVLSTATDAEFRNRRTTTIVNRSAIRFDFSVAQENSHWHINTQSQSYQPAYTGVIWIDQENFRVLRIEMSAREIPKGFPLDTVESTVDYDYVRLSEEKFLLPVHAESLSCSRGTSDCLKNTTDFRNYRKYGADTNITFDQPDR